MDHKDEIRVRSAQRRLSRLDQKPLDYGLFDATQELPLIPVDDSPSADNAQSGRPA